MPHPHSKNSRRHSLGSDLMLSDLGISRDIKLPPLPPDISDEKFILQNFEELKTLIERYSNQKVVLDLKDRKGIKRVLNAVRKTEKSLFRFQVELMATQPDESPQSINHLKTVQKFSSDVLMSLGAFGLIAGGSLLSHNHSPDFLNQLLRMEGLSISVLVAIRVYERTTLLENQPYYKDIKKIYLEMLNESNVARKQKEYFQKDKEQKLKMIDKRLKQLDCLAVHLAMKLRSTRVNSPANRRQQLLSLLHKKL